MRNRALVYGNKRLGWLAVVVFYGLNDVTPEAPDDDAYDLVIALASGTTDDPVRRSQACQLALTGVQPRRVWRARTRCGI